MTQVYVSSVIDAAAGEVWGLVRDFDALPDWHPAIAESHIEQGFPPDKVGCVRNFRLQGGEGLREQLLALSDYEFFCTYAILDSPMPLRNYVATLRLLPITDGDRCFAEWSAEFDCAAGDEAELVRNIGENVFQSGFDALKERFSR